MSFVYLASPYTHPDPAVMDGRYREAMRATKWLLDQRIWVYSPIIHCHELVQTYNMSPTHDFWLDYNKAMLDEANALYILTLDGWGKSSGIQAEVNHFWHRCLPIIFLKCRGNTYERDPPQTQSRGIERCPGGNQPSDHP